MTRAELIEHLCRIQHDAYENAARKHNWSTNMKSRVPWDSVPESNKATMRDSMAVVLEALEAAALLDTPSVPQ